MISEWYTLPNGVQVVTRVIYTLTESRGPVALVVTATVSLCAVVAILVAMAISGFKTGHQFVRSQVGAYFLSLVLSDLLQAAGSVMNYKWVVTKGVSTGAFCTTQAALKQSGNVGTALWSLVIAIHTFCLLFLRFRISDKLFYATLVSVWFFIAFIVMMGPAILHKSEKGPYWGISGYWCWITDGYHVEQLTEEYLFMFLAAATSFVLYSLIFLRLRGNLEGFGWSFKFRRVKEPWVENGTDESQMSTAGKQMLWYPVAYTVIIFPIAVCRWSAIFGHEVPYWATMTSDSIFMLSGFVNAILYSATRNIVSVRALLPFSHLIRTRPQRRLCGDSAAHSKAYLDAMQFARPLSSSFDGKCYTCPSSIRSVSPHKPRSSPSIPFAEYFRRHVLPQRSSDQRFGEYLDAATLPRTHSGNGDLPNIQTTFQPPKDPPKGFVITPQRTRSLEDGIEETLHEIVPNANSEVSLTTDGAPSIHHKRFSGWSLPSVRGGLRNSLESVHIDLEEMQFAPPPSPVRQTRQQPQLFP